MTPPKLAALTARRVKLIVEPLIREPTVDLQGGRSADGAGNRIILARFRSILTGCRMSLAG